MFDVFNTGKNKIESCAPKHIHIKCGTEYGIQGEEYKNRNNISQAFFPLKPLPCP
jgi:hypothetical protein